jgi:hypothetical protein
MKVDRVIRLNEPRYDASVFTNAGISHDELEFTDGSSPKPHIIDAFIKIVDAHFE